MPNFMSVYEDVWRHGVSTTARNMGVKQLLNTSITEPCDVFYTRSKDNPGIGLIEGVQFIAGTADMKPIMSVAPHAKHELFGLSSFYGPRVASQIPRVIAELRANPDSRRAVLSVAHPHDSPDTVSCTAAIQFNLIPPSYDALCTTVYMRSSDLVYGMPYDLIQFSMLANAIANCVGAETSTVTVFSGNAHIYDATAVYPSAWREAQFDMPVRFVEWNQWVAWARDLVYRTPSVTKSTLFDMFNVISDTRR